jgi:hypothetical protein
MKSFSCNIKKGVISGHKICWAIFLMSLFVLIAQLASAEVNKLQIEDCSKCHLFETKILSLHGGKHATVIGCLDCHPQHPPNNDGSKMSCTDCHERQTHYQAGNCRHCHVDPHQPLTSLRDPLKPARKECLSCHPKVGQQMKTSPSHHAKLFCNRCHNRHKEIPSCLDCHIPHREGQTMEVCSKCHPAHQPLKISPTGYIPATLCRPCHQNQANALAETNSRHGGINCTYCHKGQHPSVTSCQECHGLPHTQSIHSQFRDCLECHGDAHRLISNQ